MSNILIEKYNFGIKTAGGIKTNLPASFRGGLSSATFVRGGAAVLTPGATVSVNPALGNVFTLTPGEDEAINATSAQAGQYVTIVVTTSGVTSRTLTFGTNFKSTGTLATGTTTAKVFTVTFVGDGTNLNEVSRTTAM